MEMLAFPGIKTRGNGQIGKKGCRQKKGMLGKLAGIDVLARHVAEMSPTFPTKLDMIVTFDKTDVACSTLLLIHLSILAHLFIPWIM